jgi:D-glycero-alpha-D-manno-heptose-7-phosphate kinase
LIVTRTPFRLSICGGGSDYPTFSSRFGGVAVGSAITLYSYVTVRTLPPYFDYKTRLSYSKIETVKSNDDIEHRAIRATIRRAGLEGAALEALHYADLPSRSGVGSSSSFVVGLVNALSCLKGEYAPPDELRATATAIEQVDLNETVGLQDQTFAAYGGFNRIDFRPDGSVDVTPLPYSAPEFDALASHLHLFFVGGRDGTASDVAASYRPDDAPLHAAKRYAEDAWSMLLRHDFRGLADAVEGGWRAKVGLSPLVCPPHVQAAYDKARLAGAWGCKLLGAGGGGCLLAVAPPEKAVALDDALGNRVRFSFDFGGSRVVYTDRRAG